MTSTFAHLGLPDPLVQSLAKREITEPFPVQEATIPDALAGRDICGKAPTGSGKTLAFGLPLLTMVDKASRLKPRALVLAPTRELAEQIKQELAPLARTVNRYVFAVYGGVGYGPQKGALRKGVDVLVATPGRLEDLIEQRSIDLSDVDIVVVDEADRMADMGFLPAVRRILDQTSADRQTMLFSATLDGDVAVLIRDYQDDPAQHEAGAMDSSESIDARHHFWLVDHHDRVQHTADLVDEMGKTIVFTRTRHGADRLARQLDKTGIDAVAMHGGRSQNQRTRALKAFSSGRAQALIATDVAARGIHVDDVASVIHFDPAGDHKDYLHRSGRTARAGASGTVVSLVTGEQRRSVQRMQRDLRLDAPIERPRMDDLHGAGHRIGEPTSTTSTRRPSPKRSTAKARRQDRGRADAQRTDAQRTDAQRTDAQSLYVANLPWGATTDELKDLFGRYGKVHETTIISHPRTGRSKGFGFVEMPVSDARTAVKELHGSVMGGRDLTVRLARPKGTHT
jgi:superfamily II DNA/RNA helicase